MSLELDARANSGLILGMCMYGVGMEGLRLVGIFGKIPLRV